MVLALAALAAAAASFPTGFGFGAGYGAGVRIGYDVIYPKIAPFAAKITDDIIGQVGKLFGGDAGQIATQSGATSGFNFAAEPTKGSERFGKGGADIASVVTQFPSQPRVGKADLSNLARPLTRTQTVWFNNYKNAVEGLNKLSKFDRAHANKFNSMHKKARTAISNAKWWPLYYRWLEGFA